MTSGTIDPEDRWLHRVGGISALAIGVGYFAIVALYIPMGAPPNGAEARLGQIAENARAWWAILGLSVVTDVLFLPLAMSLYAALRQFHRNAMLLAATFIAMFVLLDLGLTWTNYAALITLSGRYAETASEAQRATVVAAAEYPTVIVESDLLFVYNSLTLALGFIAAGFVMRKGVFSKGTAYLSIVTGTLGVVSVAGPFVLPALGVMIVVTSVLSAVLVLLLGARLYRLGSAG